MLAGATLLAQDMGSLKGQVTDQTGAVVVNATVTATSAKGKTFTASTNRQGVYEIRDLAPGAYDIAVTAPGFAKFSTDQLAVAAGKAQPFDVSLEIEVKSEKVNVEDTNTQLDLSASNNASSIVLKGKDLDALSDDPDDLQSDLQALAGPSAGPNGGQIYIDGFTNGQLPPKSAIREVRINSNPFSAEFDRIGYGRIEIFTKPGSDKFHGQAMFNFNNEIFNARNPFNHGAQPGYQTAMYNANVGGPINKKSSFFLNVQRRNQDETSIVNAVVLDNNFNQVPFSTAIPNPVTRTEINPRIDYQLTKNNTLTVRYEYNRNESTSGGISTFTLPTLASNSSRTNHELQVSDSQVLSTTVVNDTRFQYEHGSNSSLPVNLTPTISVQGAFTGGGSGGGISNDHSDQYELQNSTRMTRGRHLITFGGRLRVQRDANKSTSGYNGSFTFDSLTAYQITMQGLAQGLAAATIRANGGGASQFRLSAGTPLVTVSQADAGLFAEDTWAIRKNITITTGLRFETQDNIPNHFNFAPRVGFAWGLGNPDKGASKTVLRLGGGIFYDRFSESLVMQAQRLNGITQQQYIITNPDFYPNVPPISSLTGALSSPTTYTIAPDLHAPYMIQGAATLERQVTKTATLSVTYLHSKGVHQLLTHNINAPLPGTYTGPGTGVRPLGGNGNVYEYFSEGTFKQDQIITNANVRLGQRASLNSFYVLSWANGNASGASSFPVNQYSLADEYGRTAFDVRQRFFIGGSVTAPFGIRLNPFVIVSSGMPFNITLGRDLNGDSIFNDRPTFATTPCDGKIVICSRWGAFNTMPLAGQTVVPVYYGTGPGQFNFNLRVSKVIGFGPSKEGEANRGRGDGGPHGGGDHGPGGGRPGGGMIRMGGGGPFGGGGGTSKRYSLTISANANNLFNHVNLATPVGNLTSPLFGTSNAIVGGFGGGAAANRRLSLQLMFGF
jgi:hypothetical protein